MDNPVSREYFYEECNRMRRLMGKVSFWNDLEMAANAYRGLLYVYLHTDKINEDDRISMQAITLEYDMRLSCILLNTTWMAGGATA